MGHANILVIGCGKMGGALVSGWIAGGWPKENVRIVEAHAETRAAWAAKGVAVHASAAEIPTDFAPGAVLIAVKPQGLADALPPVAARLANLRRRPLIVSIVAGKPISAFEAAFGADIPVLRVMPNTPAAVGRGISGLYANSAATLEQRDLGETLMRAVGETVWLAAEDQMHAVTALSAAVRLCFHNGRGDGGGGAALALPPIVR
jgi:pyrroline-5-carboxylate reductase